jgi:putative endonuclease
MVERSPRRQVVGSNPAGPRNLMFHVYVLKSEKTGRRYIGSCENLATRVTRHNLGHSKTTRHGVPWSLVHTKMFCNRADATRRER